MLYIIFLSFRFQIYLLNSVACLYRSFRNEHTWFLYLNLKAVSQRPMYVSFDKAAPTYQQALEKSGYEHRLKFHATTDDQTHSEERTRPQNITWYNPPFSKNVATNVGNKFLCIVKESFTPGHPLRKIFNRNTLKVSYSCMPNLERKISTHNKFCLVNNSQSQEKSCNCRDKHSCPLGGDCLIQNMVYQATVVSPMGRETYIGLTANQFKPRFRNHTASFRNESKRNPTELSKHIWSLKDAKTEFTMTWKIMARARPYSNVTKRCNLCITEKFFIICKPGAGTLNKRNELASACRHTAKYLIKHA